MRGLIAGAIGGMAGAVGDIADGQIKTNQVMDLKGQMAQIELEKQLRIDEVLRDRDVQDIGRKAEATAAAAPIVAQGEANAFISTVNTPGYLDANKRLADAKAPPARGPSGIDAEINDLRRLLSETTDETERANLMRRINDLSGSPATGAKTYGDMVAAAGHYSRMADAQRKQAEALKYDDPKESQRLLIQARNFESQADSILQETRGRRLGDGGVTTAPQPSNPERTATGGPIDGPWNKYR